MHMRRATILVLETSVVNDIACPRNHEIANEWRHLCLPRETQPRSASERVQRQASPSSNILRVPRAERQKLSVPSLHTGNAIHRVDNILETMVRYWTSRRYHNCSEHEPAKLELQQLIIALVIEDWPCRIGNEVCFGGHVNASRLALVVFSLAVPVLTQSSVSVQMRTQSFSQDGSTRTKVSVCFQNTVVLQAPLCIHFVVRHHQMISAPETSPLINCESTQWCCCGIGTPRHSSHDTFSPVPVLVALGSPRCTHMGCSGLSRHCTHPAVSSGLSFCWVFNVSSMRVLELLCPQSGDRVQAQ